MTAFIGVDWGTTNLRAWRLSENRVEHAIEKPIGVAAVDRDKIERVFDTEVHQPLGANLPVLMCGMVGSNLGWRASDYVDCPAGATDLVQHLVTVREAPLVRIVPGLRCPGIAGAPDVMRGEETQIVGWLQRAAGETHVACLPGTHSKWALVSAGRVQRFFTAMTGELFSVLSQHSILANDANAFDESAFDAGVEAAGDGGMLSLRLFSARARTVAGANPAHTAAYLSGLLIGSEIAAALRLFEIAPAAHIALVASEILQDRYSRALAQCGRSAVALDGDQAAIAGLRALVELGALQ